MVEPLYLNWDNDEKERMMGVPVREELEKVLKAKGALYE